MDLTRWNDGSDAELEDLVGHDLEMLELSRRVRAAWPEPRIDPEFQRRLRAQLMTAAETQLRPRGLGRLLRPRASLFAYGAAGLGTAMIAAAALAYYAPHSDQFTVVQVASTINEQHSVNPDDVITISFNHEMDHQAVERGLTIQPATTLKTAWKGTELILTPEHHLQANSPYVVTIPKNAARDVKGDIAGKDIHITFGTSPVAPSNPVGRPAGPVTLVGHDAGGVGDGSLLGFSGDGSLLATAGLVPSPAGSAGGSTPGAGGADAPLPPVPALVRYGSDGPVRLGDPVSAVALSPTGHSLATIGPSSDGLHAVIAVSDTDGSHRSILSSAADPASPLSWGGDATHPVLLFVSGGQLTSVDLEHRLHAVSAVHLAAGQVVRLAPSGGWAFVGPAAAATSPGSTAPVAPSAPLAPSPPLVPGVRIGQGDVVPGANPDAATNAEPYSTTPDAGRIVDLGTGASAAAPPQLTGMAAGDLPSFSADGHRVAWIDHSVAQPAIVVAPLDGSGPGLRVNLSHLAAGDDRTALTLDAGGDRVAYALTHGDGTGQLRVVRVSDGTLLAGATVRQPSGLVFSPDGAELGYLQHTTSQTVAELAPVPGAPTGVTSVPAAARSAIDRLVTAEVAGDRQALDGLVAPVSVETDLLSHLPDGLSRGYVISAVPSSGSDVVTAQIRLLRDPTNGHPTAAFTDQKVVLHRAGEAFVVAQSDITRPLHDEPSGPQVVHVDTHRLLTVTTVQITFDSDLDPSSVNDQVIGLSGAGSDLATPRVSYDAASRTVTVTFNRLRQPLGLSVGIGLRDVNGQGLAAPFNVQVTPGR